MVRISIIIPVYNSGDKIKRCIESIISQISVEDEILLMNDGSTDGTLAVLKQLENSYKAIRVIDKRNEGVAITRNRGISEARGEYICFIDNDDYIDKDYIATFYNAISQGNYDIVIGGYRRVTDQKVLFEYRVKDTDWYKLMVVSPWARIFRREFVVKNNICFLDSKIGEDVYFNFKAYSRTDRIKIIDYTGYNWWFNDKSISNTSQRGFRKDVDIRKLLDSLFALTGRQRLYDFYYVRYVVWYLLFSGRAGTSEDFMKEYNHGITWLKERGIPIRFPVFSKDIRGESIKNRVIIAGFIMIHRLRMVRLFSKIYCKG